MGTTFIHLRELMDMKMGKRHTSNRGVGTKSKS